MLALGIPLWFFLLLCGVLMMCKCALLSIIINFIQFQKTCLLSLASASACEHEINAITPQGHAANFATPRRAD
jgi:multisubunit Na+/H+ antiporter MnhC subunit